MQKLAARKFHRLVKTPPARNVALDVNVDIVPSPLTSFVPAQKSGVSTSAPGAFTASCGDPGLLRPADVGTSPRRPPRAWKLFGVGLALVLAISLVRLGLVASPARPGGNLTGHPGFVPFRAAAAPMIITMVRIRSGLTSVQFAGSSADRHTDCV